MILHSAAISVTDFPLSEQDGSEIRSAELERLTLQGIRLLERRDSMEFFRDEAADLFEAHTGSSWRPRSGSKVSHRALTSAVIDSRDFLAARRRADNPLLMPAGTKIAFAGGADCNDRIWDVLDKVFAKHPDMVLLHGGTAKGAERIAACWAEKHKVFKSSSSPTGPGTANRRRSNATTSSSKPCRSV
jgi:YspA, cpYpsA-related SLOG family